MDGFFMIVKAKYHVYGMAGGGKPHPAGAVFLMILSKRVCQKYLTHPLNII